MRNCVCIIDWQEASNHVNWAKLMQILKGTGINWHKRRLISKLCMNQSGKIRVDHWETRSVMIGRVRQGCCLSPILVNLYSKYLTREAPEWCRIFKIGGYIICTVKYADYLVLLAKEEMVLQGMIDKLLQIGRYYGMEMNIGKTKVMSISRQPSSIDYEKSKPIGELEIFQLLGKQDNK